MKSTRVRIFFWLCLTLVLPSMLVAAYVRHRLTNHVEQASVRDRTDRVERAATRAADLGARDKRSAEFLCDRDIGIEQLLLATEPSAMRQATSTLEADLRVLQRQLDVNAVVVFDLDQSTLLAHHEGPDRAHRPSGGTYAWPGFVAQAQAAGDRSFVHERFSMHACEANRHGRRLLVGVGHIAPAPPRSAADALALAQTHRIDELAFGIVGLAILYALLLAWLVARAIETPLREVEQAAARVASGDLDSTIRSKFGGEADRTMGAFNRMTQELNRTQQRLLRAERIAAWRDIARRIAHEIKNPLLPIQMSIETMRKTYQSKHPDFDEIFNESTAAVLEEVERLKHIVTEFSRFARMPRPRPEELDLRELVNHVVAMHASSSAMVSARMPDRPVLVRADRDQLGQVLVNLVQNAIDASSAKPRDANEVAAVSVVVEELPDGVALSVSDNGPGIPEDARNRIFEPYFTTKSHGTGLGLAIVHRIVSDHGGTLDVGVSEAGGALIRVMLTREGPPIEADTSLA